MSQDGFLTDFGAENWVRERWSRRTVRFLTAYERHDRGSCTILAFEGLREKILTFDVELVKMYQAQLPSMHFSRGRCDVPRNMAAIYAISVVDNRTGNLKLSL